MEIAVRVYQANAMYPEDFHARVRADHKLASKFLFISLFELNNYLYTFFNLGAA
jgi:hypothetical protein